MQCRQRAALLRSGNSAAYDFATNRRSFFQPWETCSPRHLKTDLCARHIGSPRKPAGKKEGKAAVFGPAGEAIRNAPVEGWKNPLPRSPLKYVGGRAALGPARVRSPWEEANLKSGKRQQDFPKFGMMQRGTAANGTFADVSRMAWRLRVGQQKKRLAGWGSSQKGFYVQANFATARRL